MKTFAQFRENFADGRNPQDKGDSARHGIPKKASIAQLEKIRSSDSSSPRKKQLAHWQINMRRGKAKANEQYGERIIAWREKERPTNSFAIQGHQVHADSDGMKIYHGGELIHHYKGDYSNPTNADKQKARLFIGKRVQNMKRNEDYENPYRFDWGTPEGTAYMKKKTPKMKFEPMFKNTKVSLPATKKIISSSQ